MLYIRTVIIIILYTIAIKVIDTRVSNSSCCREMKTQNQLIYIIKSVLAFSCNGCKGLPHLFPGSMANREDCSDFRRDTFCVYLSVRFVQLFNCAQTYVTNCFLMNSDRTCCFWLWSKPKRKIMVRFFLLRNCLRTLGSRVLTSFQ